MYFFDETELTNIDIDLLEKDINSKLSKFEEVARMVYSGQLPVGLKKDDPVDEYLYLQKLLLDLQVYKANLRKGNITQTAEQNASEYNKTLTTEERLQVRINKAKEKVLSKYKKGKSKSKPIKTTVSNWPAELLDSEETKLIIDKAFTDVENLSPLSAIIGINDYKQPVIKDFATAPHVKIGGSAGSGKTVAMHQFILTIMKHAAPEEVRFILSDFKKVEFTAYKDNPFLLTEPLTDIDMTKKALEGLVTIMDRRLSAFEKTRAKNIEMFNKLQYINNGIKMPYILFVVDELSDLVLNSEEGEKINDLLRKIASLSRQVGIHLMVGTWSPTHDVLDDSLKANLPATICYSFTREIDSYRLLGEPSAVDLNGHGDSLVKWTGSSESERVKTLYFSNTEIKKINDYLIKKYGTRDDRAFNML